ncbi:MAG: hypothetical protein IJI43_01025 [Bacilli bacterium]|nr:hypothetical protein [Bacilli bacterium]
MINYRTSMDNRNYFVMENGNEFFNYLRNNYFSGEEIIKKACNDLEKFINNNDTNYKFENVAIRKDSELGQYITKREGILFSLLDKKITTSDIVSAYDVAVYLGNPIADKLRVIYDNNITGEARIIALRYGGNVVDYISRNRDYHRSIAIEDGYYKTNDSIIFDDNCTRGNLVKIAEKENRYDKKKVHKR